MILLALALALAVVLATYAEASTVTLNHATEAELLAHIDHQRGDMIALDNTLIATARWRAADMATRNRLTHTMPDGNLVFSKLDAAGFEYLVAGEIVARNDYQDSVSVAMRGWMASPSHRDILLDRTFNLIGLGTAKQGNMTYFAVIFARQETW